jgi:pyrroline-5-carboxylate reductase
VLSLELQPRGPFSLALSARLASNATRRFRNGTLTALLPAGEGAERAAASQRADGTVRLEAESERGLERLRFMLALDDDHSEFLERFGGDALLGRSTRVLRGLRPLRLATVAHALLRALTGQLISAAEARRIERRVVRRVSTRDPSTGLWLPPTRERLGALSPAEVCRLGLAPQRAAALVRLCRTLDLERLRGLSPASVAARLRRERTLGPWSIGVIALQGTGAWSQGLDGDLGLMKLCAARSGRWVDAAETTELLSRYSEWAGLASVYLLRGMSLGLVPLPRAVPDLTAAARRARRRCAARPRSAPRSRLRASMSVDSRRIAVLGAGKIGEALIHGLVSSGWRKPDEIIATDLHEDRVTELRERYGIEATTSNLDAVARASIVVVAVKPQDLPELLREIASAIGSEQTVLSIAAAVPTAKIEAHLGADVPVVRAMPNTPATVQEGMAGICAGAHAREQHLALAEDVLAHLGRVVRVPEYAMDAVTAVSGSGPAYFALLAEAMIEAGILLGLSREISTALVVQTMFGTAKLLRDEKIHPVELRENVTSPGGTTIRAIRELERAGVRAAFLNAIQAAMERSRELAEGDV